MTSLWQNNRFLPVTILEALPMKKVVNSGKKIVTFMETKKVHLKKPQQGFLKKNGIEPLNGFLRELDDQDLNYSNILKLNDLVDVTSISKGKGFAGAMKRWNFKGQRASHGNSLSHRAIGSTGCRIPNRTLPGKKMPGHLGVDQTTIKNLQIIRIDNEKNYIAICGGVPGANGSIVKVSIK